MVGGMAGLGCVALIMSRLSLEGGPWPVRILMFALGVCMAYIFLPNQAASMATISRADTGRASTLFSVQRQIGSAVGIAVLGSVMAIGGNDRRRNDRRSAKCRRLPCRLSWRRPPLPFLARCIALRVPDSEAAHTMVRSTKPGRIRGSAPADR